MKKPNNFAKIKPVVMEKGLCKKYQKAHWMSDDFGRGKNPNAKRRNRRVVKKKTNSRMKRDFKKSDE